MTQAIPSIFERRRRDLEEELRKVIKPFTSQIYDLLRYHLGWVDEKGKRENGNSGKALRPSLCLYACTASGGDWKQALPAAAALELIHNFSLIHDDIQDRDMERRHRKTVWTIWGESQGINAGDAMAFMSQVSLANLWNTGLAPQRIRAAYALLNEATLQMIEGQSLDLTFENRSEVTVEEYLDMISKKTGALLRCSLEMGAAIGTSDTNTIAAFRKAGEKLGLAFQIRDDILGIWGDEKVTGKPMWSDIHRKKKSMPVVMTVNGKQGSQVKSIYAKEKLTGTDVETILQIMETSKSRKQCEEWLAKACHEASAEIAKVKMQGDIRKDFDDLLTFLTERDY
ncbi:MAG: polyprenyl synthetase family protein [Dehalococcoidia bacterium]|nr:polyprenyl synthetase family protein [Dehalococcoidia bacterium]